RRKSTALVPEGELREAEGQDRSARAVIGMRRDAASATLTTHHSSLSTHHSSLLLRAGLVHHFIPLAVLLDLVGVRQLLAAPGEDVAAFRHDRAHVRGAFERELVAFPAVAFRSLEAA